MFITMMYVILAILTTASFTLWSLKATQRLFIKLNEKIIYAKMAFFDKTPAGRIVNRVSNDVYNLDD